MLKDESMDLEFAAVHKGIFGNSPIYDDSMREQYRMAVNKLLNETSKLPCVKVHVEKAVENSLDLEAIEYFIRLKYGRNTLSQRFHILTFMAESRAGYYDFFVNESSSFLIGFLRMTQMTLRSVLKLIKGFYLTKRYQLV